MVHGLPVIGREADQVGAGRGYPLPRAQGLQALRFLQHRYQRQNSESLRQVRKQQQKHFHLKNNFFCEVR